MGPPPTNAQHPVYNASILSFIMPSVPSVNILSMNDIYPKHFDSVEYWRARLVAIAENYDTMSHPEVIRVSEILDRCIVNAQSHIAWTQARTPK